MKKTIFITGLFLFVMAGLSAQVKFEFKQKKGNSGSYISTVEEDVYVNNVPSHHAEIINRISSKMTNVASDGEAFIYATYMTTENSISQQTGRSLSWGEDPTCHAMRPKILKAKILKMQKKNCLFKKRIQGLPWRSSG